MANICYNKVTFSGEPENLRAVNAFFDDLIVRSMEGRQPDDSGFIEHGKGYYSEPFRTGENSVHYRTFWQPRLEAIYDIAEEFGVSYVHEYQDLNMGLYGRAMGGGGEFLDVRLGWSAFEQIGYSESDDTYYYDDLPYASIYPVLDLVLDQKINAQQNGQSMENGPRPGR